MSSMNITAALDFEALLRPFIEKIRENMCEELKKRAEQIITEEMAKFVLDLAKVVSFKDYSDHLVITLRKEIQ